MSSRFILPRIPPRSFSLQVRTISSLNSRLRVAGSVSLLDTARRPRQTYPPLSPYVAPSIHQQPFYAVGFHSTPPRNAWPLIPFFASVFKASAGIELARMAGRIALTFIPLLWMSGVRSKHVIRHAAIHGIPVTEEKREKHVRRLRVNILLLKFLLAVPFTLFWATVIGGLERTPLTGRWRTVLLSPEEEDDIAARLAGPGWYNAVGEILAGEGSPKALPPSDWRYQWVRDTLRTLEASLPVLSHEPDLCPDWTEGGPNDIPLPPPAEYPLRPRPRASEYLRWFCDSMTRKDKMAPEISYGPLGSIAGPPYSLLVVEKPDCSNAFSYGFGPEGGSGIVVYSGFLDDIFAKNPIPEPSEVHTPQPSIWSWLFGGLFTTPPTPSHQQPTQEQTNELAILLAHEMSHLVLSHHLESLSSVEVMIPGALSIVSDVVRVLIFPITAFFGPFVNDAVAQLGKVGSGELAKISEYCTSVKQEIEADVVSARILAHAGFDARDAITFWERRSDEAECARLGSSKDREQGMHLERMIHSDTHPIGETRIQSLREELDRWEKERQKARQLAKDKT